MCQEAGTHGRIARCAWWKCSKMFAICEGCEAGYKYCSESCKRAARVGQVRRAKGKYARSTKGKTSASKRNVKYRTGVMLRRLAKFSGKIETDHISSQDLARATDAFDAARAVDGSAVRAEESPCDDVDSQSDVSFRLLEREDKATLSSKARGGAVAPRPRAAAPTLPLQHCQFCGAPIRWFVSREKLRERIAERRRPRRSGKRSPRLPVGPPG